MNTLLTTPPDQFLKKMQEFTAVLNEAPKPEWILQHDGWDYIPVSVIETELAVLFHGLHKFEILSERTEKGEQIVTIRLHYFHPVMLEWMFHDGIGAALIDYVTQGNLKAAAALAYSEGIKVAAKKLGKRFGADLNRTEKGDYLTEATTRNGDMQPVTQKFVVHELSDLLKQNIAECETTEQLTELWDGNKDMHSNKEFTKLVLTRKKALKANGTA